MELQKLTAIIRRSRLEDVEGRLVECGMGGFSVSVVQGIGEYADFFSKDWKVTHVKLQIFATKDQVDVFAPAIQEAAQTSSSGDGLIAVASVNRLVRIRIGSAATEEELHERCEC